MACLRLFTLRPEPLLSVPFFRRRIVDSTFFDADFPYFAIVPPAVPPTRVMCCRTQQVEDANADPRM